MSRIFGKSEFAGFRSGINYKKFGDTLAWADQHVVGVAQGCDAEHAVKFAELIGEVVEKDTEANLKARVAAGNGACLGKKAIATKAKELGYDAIHDTVHEMCKDEARHGMAFAGLLKRYFKG